MFSLLSNTVLHYPSFLFDGHNGGGKLMASISYILSHEDTNTSSIHLHQDGIFLRAYERSAYLFAEGTACDYKLSKRYIRLVDRNIKLVDRNIVSLGFP